jgi:hypothetical protein
MSFPRYDIRMNTITLDWCETTISIYNQCVRYVQYHLRRSVGLDIYNSNTKKRLNVRLPCDRVALLARHNHLLLQVNLCFIVFFIVV